MAYYIDTAAARALDAPAAWLVKPPGVKRSNQGSPGHGKYGKTASTNDYNTRHCLRAQVLFLLYGMYNFAGCTLTKSQSWIKENADLAKLESLWG